MLTAALHVKCNSKKGRYLNDVRMGRGRGVPKKQMIVLISCVSVTVTRGEGVTKILKFCGRHLSVVPCKILIIKRVTCILSSRGDVLLKVTQLKTGCDNRPESGGMVCGVQFSVYSSIPSKYNLNHYQTLNFALRHTHLELFGFKV